MAMNHVESFFLMASAIARSLSQESKIGDLVRGLENLRFNKGRLFVLGVGGSAANASHAVNDFRKLCNIEAYAPTDNVSELTARTNDEGWETVFIEWLKVSQLNERDALLIMSVGGGDLEKQISVNLINAITYARVLNAKVFGIVGNPDGYTAQNADTCVLIPAFNTDIKTPLTEAFQALVWHCLVSHPELQQKQTKW